MGPNGSGKSTLAKVLAGHPQYEVTAGEIIYEGRNLLEMSPDERAREGVFMAFQYPIEVPGVSNAQFLRLAYNEKKKHHGEEELDPLEFKDLLKERAKVVEMDASFMTLRQRRLFRRREEAQRDSADGGARTEARRARRTDSGLDIDALARGGKRRQSTAHAGQRDHRRHSLPATPELHRSGFCTRARRRSYRSRGRQGAGARLSRVEGLRLDQDGRQRKRSEGRRSNGYRTRQIRKQLSNGVSRELSQTVPWLELVRSSAMDWFEQLGFPSVREEDWKYTNLAPLAKENFVPAIQDTAVRDVSQFAYPETEGAHLVVVNGFLREDLSQTSGLGDAVAVDLFSAAADARYNKIIRKYLARNRLSQQRPDGSEHGVFAVGGF